MKQVPLKLKKLPSVLTLNKFDKNGLVKGKKFSTDSKELIENNATYLINAPPMGQVESPYSSLVPAYIASELGFNKPGSDFLNKEFYYRLIKESGVLPLCPFAACNEYLDKRVFDERLPVKKNKALWNKFGDFIGQVNYETLMPRAKFLVAILDGSHHVDDGASAEIGHFATKYERPIIGIRSDFRLAENPAAPINCAVRYFIDGGGSHGGKFFDGPNAYGNAYTSIKKLADVIREHAPR